jgi:glucosyl-3-phosphoglycerate synthase
VGYAVELAALIDTHRLLGPDAIAQVDLGRRAHRHQALRDLGAMAVQILAASHSRSSARPDDRERVLLHQHRQQEGELTTVTRDIDLLERPPAASLL